MRKIKNILSKALLTSLALVMSVSMTIGAAEWINVFAEDFESITTVPSDYIVPDADKAFSASVTDGALETKYVSPVYIEPTRLNNRTVELTDDSGLIEVFKNGSYKAYLKDTVTDAYTFKVFSETGNNTYFVTDMGGSKAFRIGSHAVAATKFRYNRLWLLADKNQEVFKTTDNKAKIIVEYYAVDDTPDNDFGMAQTLTVNYNDSSNAAKSKSITISDSDLNTWKEWEIDLDDIDFTKTTTKDSSPWNISFSTPYTAELNSAPTVSSLTSSQRDPGFEVYIRSIRILKVDNSAPKFSNSKKTVQIPLGEGGICGDSKVKFDLTIGAEDYSMGGAYRVSVANENKDELATLQIENNGDTQTIYAISSDGSGNEVKSDALYTGDILDQTITCTLEMSFRDKIYTLSVEKDGSEIAATSSAVEINNLHKVSGCAFADFLVVTHSQNSVGTKAVIDNISFDYVEDPAGTAAKEDLDAIVLEDEVEFEFELPSIGSINESEIVWESSDSAVLSIETVDGVITATPHCVEESQQVKLTATATLDSVSCVKEFTLTVAEHADHIKLEEEKETLKITSLGASLRAEEQFEVPTQGSDETVSISWSSDDIDYTDGTAIVVINGVAEVYRGEFDGVVTLTATITVGSFSDTKEFAITIPGLDGVKATIGAIATNPSTVDGIDYISPAVRVEAPGVSGPLTFAAYALDANGKVIDVKEHTQAVTEYSTFDFAITNLKTTGSTEVKYYFWDANGVSIINNEPTQIKDLTATGKAKGVKVEWSAALDDFEAIAYYAVYKDGVLVATTEDTFYLDTEAEIGEEHSYKVVPYDKNDLCPAKSNEGKAAVIEMYYIDFENRTSLGVGEHSPGGSYVIWGTTSYDGINVALAEKSKAIGLTVSSIPATDTEITFEVEYLDNAAAIRLDFMMRNEDGSASRTGCPVEGSGGATGEWKTGVVRVPNITFVKSTVVSGGDVLITGNDTVIIKSVKLIQSALYD